MGKEEKTNGRKPYSIMWWVHHIFLFSVFLMIWHLGLHWKREIVSPRVSQSLGDGKRFTGEHAFQYKPTNPLDVELSYSSPNLPTLNTSRPGIKSSGAAPVPQSPLILFKIANPKPAYSALPIPSCWNHKKGPGLCLPRTPPAFWPMLLFPLMALHGMSFPPLRICG